MQNDKQKTLSEWAAEINQWAEEKGWNKSIDFRAVLMNLHSEITEAWEEIRNGRQIMEVYNEPGNKPCGVPIELVGLLIRLLHIMEFYGMDIEGLLELKMAYNRTRPYRHGGKTA